MDLEQLRQKFIAKQGKPPKPTKQRKSTFFTSHITTKHKHAFQKPASDKLLGFQVKGVFGLEEFNGCALLADDPGLGKTAQVLSWLERRPDLRPAVILCPAFLKLNWEVEAKMWMKNPKVEVVDGTFYNGRNLKGKDIIIINYDILANDYKEDRDEETGKKIFIEKKNTGWVDFLIGLAPKVVAADECHFIKNETAFRTKATAKLMKQAPHRIGISATAFENKPIELFPILKMIRPDIFNNKYVFGKRYCGGKRGTFGWEFKKATNTKELHTVLVNNLMIRRRKKHVLKDLPDKARKVFPIKLDNDKQYREAEKDFLAWLKSKKNGKAKVDKAVKAEALMKIHTLEKIAYRGKISASIEWISNFLESGEKLVVFAHNISVVGMIYRAFKDVAVKIDGTMSVAQKQKATEQFQNNEGVKLLIGNIKAAGVGWTFTAASNVAFIQYPWSPSQLVQAEDRIHRIGQTAAGVTIWYLLAYNTIEVDRLNTIHLKQKVFEAIMDGINSDGLGEGVMDDIFFKEVQSVEEAYVQQLLAA